MSFFDNVRAKASDLAADAERAGRVGAAQTKIAVLQQDLKNAERELGQAAFALIDRGQISHPELAAATEAVREAQRAISAKEAEIADLKATGHPATNTDAAASVTPPPPTTTLGPPAVAPDNAPPTPHVETSRP